MYTSRQLLHKYVHSSKDSFSFLELLTHQLVHSWPAHVFCRDNYGKKTSWLEGILAKEILKEPNVTGTSSNQVPFWPGPDTA